MHCDVHGKKCTLPPLVFLAMVGYSCKTLSRMNPNGCQPGALRAGSGSSGETCHALIEFLRMHRPVVCLLENVEEMGRDEDKSDNVAFFWTSWKNMAMLWQAMSSTQPILACLNTERGPGKSLFVPMHSKTPMKHKQLCVL